jgi:hypothetical protein
MAYRSKDADTFEFLNLQYTFSLGINWNYPGHGKLWAYNLTYFDFLHQPDLSTEEGVNAINTFIDDIETVQDGLEPFPISLRGINWVKFLNSHAVSNQHIDDSLYAQYQILMDNLEYHLLGNHLLENGFSLLFGAYYFQDETFYEQAKKILEAELREQILDDGAHFELSPMYHQIMLYRVLDCANLVKHNGFKNHELLGLLNLKAGLMLGWLNDIVYGDGSIPLFNDSANKIAPQTHDLNNYAKSLGVTMVQSALGASGYRKFQNAQYECVVDVGAIGPDYIPGHAHADTFSFELTMGGKPFIVDTGLSTYETGCRRDEERGTHAHNTVEVMGTDSSEVWGGFRVAKRARITMLEEKPNEITAKHDGYRAFGIEHQRSWMFDENKILIRDRLNRTAKAVARLHFHPDVTEAMITKHVSMRSDSEATISDYLYAPEFNKIIKAKVLEVSFEEMCEMEIVL